MSDYSYIAKNKDGSTISGNINASNKSEASKKLIELNLFPIQLTEKLEKASESVSNGTSSKELLLFTRQIYVLLKSGVPIVKALRSMEVSNKNIKLQYLFKSVKENIEKGSSIYNALSLHPKVFNSFYLNMIRIGETTGELEKILLELYNYIKFEQEMKSQVKSALRYPAIVISVMAIALSIIMILVVPTFAEMYKGLNTELPFPTKILIGISDFFVNYWYLLGFGAFSLFYWFKSFIQTKIGKEWWDTYKLNIPVFGDIINKSTLARFSKSFMLSIKAGIPIVQSINIVSKVINNEYYEKKLEDIQKSVEKGNSLYLSMVESNSFEDLVLEMISTGEEAGDLESMLNEIVEMYEEEIEFKLKTINSLIEPIMLLLLGGMVLLFALGIFLPIWDLGGIVTNK